MSSCTYRESHVYTDWRVPILNKGLVLLPWVILLLCSQWKITSVDQCLQTIISRLFFQFGQATFWSLQHSSWHYKLFTLVNGKNTQYQLIEIITLGTRWRVVFLDWIIETDVHPLSGSGSLISCFTARLTRQHYSYYFTRQFCCGSI